MRSALAAAAALALLAGCEKPPDPQEGYAIAFNMRCSTCNDFLACSAGEKDLVFRIHELTFWQQIATIADYLTFAEKTERTRPLTVYRTDGESISVESGEAATASIDTVAGIIAAAQFTIDQRTGELDVSGKSLGTCNTMTRREGFALVRRFLGRPLPGGSG